MESAISENVPMTDAIAAMRASPVHGLVPLEPNPQEIEIEKIDFDSTNPGGVTTSLRYTRREQPIRDSYEILGGIIYPPIVAESETCAGRYVHIDGFGRLQQLRERGVAMVRAIVYRPMNLEQRILFRQTLNGAQQPFDVSSILKDLQQLATERHLNVADKGQVKTLLRDLPENVRKYEADLLILARWDPDSAARLGESAGLIGGTIGIDKLRAFDRMVNAATDRHSDVVDEIGGTQAFTKCLTDMYLEGLFSKGARSQEVIRKVNKALVAAEPNDPVVRSFFVDRASHDVLNHLAANIEKPKDIKMACQKLVEMLLEVDSSTLTDDELRTLTRTQAVLQSVLG